MAIILSTACHQAQENDKANLAELELVSENMMGIPSTDQPVSTKDITQSKRLLYRGGITFESEAVEKDYQRIAKLISQHNAYIEDENQRKSSQQISYKLRIRVPSRLYDTLFSNLTTLAYRLENRYSTIEDDIEQYHDLGSRIENKKVLEKRFQQLLPKASTVKDMLEIERNLNEVRMEIENLQGRFNSLDKEINYSTIELSFYEPIPFVYDATNRKGFGARLLSGLDNGWQGFLSFLVVVVSFWPLFLASTLSILIVLTVRSRLKNKRLKI